LNKLQAFETLNGASMRHAYDCILATHSRGRGDGDGRALANFVVTHFVLIMEKHAGIHIFCTLRN
jgi:hypothetical protein